MGSGRSPPLSVVEVPSTKDWQNVGFRIFKVSIYKKNKEGK